MQARLSGLLLSNTEGIFPNIDDPGGLKGEFDVLRIELGFNLSEIHGTGSP
jgi:hypothetical protein